MVNRWIEDDHLLDTLDEVGAGCIAFSPLAQGLLTDRYLDGHPRRTRGSPPAAPWTARCSPTSGSPRCGRSPRWPQARGQSLAQLALAWALRDPRMTSLVIGVSSVAQLEANLAALDDLSFTDDELQAIDRHATDAGVNLWAASSAE